VFCCRVPLRCVDAETTGSNAAWAREMLVAAMSRSVRLLLIARLDDWICWTKLRRSSAVEAAGWAGDSAQAVAAAQASATAASGAATLRRLEALVRNAAGESAMVSRGMVNTQTRWDGRGDLLGGQGAPDIIEPASGRRYRAPRALRITAQHPRSKRDKTLDVSNRIWQTDEYPRPSRACLASSQGLDRVPGGVYAHFD
jgi:hypothetical protein